MAMELGKLINKTYTVPVLGVPYYGPTLAERKKNMNKDLGFKKRLDYSPRRRQPKEAPTEN